MRIGVPRESLPGETRVAATPTTVKALLGLGYAVFVENDAGALASFDDAAYQAAGADVVDGEVWNADVVLKVNAPTDVEIGRLRPGQVVVSLMAPALNPDLVEKLAGTGGHRAGDGCGAAHLPGAVPRRAVLDGQHRRLPRGHRGRPRVRLVLHRPGDRCRQGSAGEGAGGRRRRRRPRGDRHRELRSARWCGPSTPAPRSPSRSSRWAREFLRIDVEDTGPSADGYATRDERRLRPQGRRALRRAGRRRRHRHHDRAHPRPPGAAAHRRGHGRLDEARLGRRRHGRVQRRQRRRHGRRARRWSPPTA